MEKRILELLEMQKTAENRTCERRPQPCSDEIPPCIDDNFCLPTPPDRNDGILTMAFVDMQPLESLYPLDTAFNCGTLFPNLNKPFFGGRRHD